MEDPPITPRTKQRRMSLLSGAKAYLGVSARPSSSSDKSKTLPRVNSEPALHAPTTPRTPSGRSKVRPSRRLSTSSSMPVEESPRPRKSSSRSSEVVGDDPQTPRAKQKIRRASLGETTSSPVSRPRRDATSVTDSIMAVSPTKKKKKRPSSLGPLKGSLDRDDSGVKSREARSAAKEKKKRPNSLGPLPREGSSRRTSRTTTPKPRQASVNALTEHLGGIPMPLEGLLQEPEDSSGRRKSRTTVDREGRIRRVKKADSGFSSDEEDTKSKQSSSSKRSKSSKMSSKSTGTKKSVTKKSKEKDAKKKLKSPKPNSSSSELGYDSDHSEKSNRTERSARSSRRAGKRIGSVLVEDASEQASNLPSLDLLEPDNGQPLSEVDNARQQQKASAIENGFDDSFERTVREKLQESAALATADLEEEVARLNKKIVELNEENLKAQFAAQSEAAKLRKELREEKLELQRSQTERRELRAELRERDVIIDESDRKIQALEKAVESQLDKVDDLEEELRRANEEIFDMEAKLGDMGRVLADSSAVETNALQKEKDFDEKRQERMERRLEEREMELEKRERKLREEREAMVKESQPRREIEQLEHDNRMLLKALNRERAEGGDKAKERDEEIKSLRQELKLAKMASYMQVENGSTDDTIAKLLQDNVDLQQKLDEEKDSASAAMTKKDEKIASLEEELERRGNAGETNGMGDKDALLREIDTLKGDFLVMKSKLEGSQRRNQLLEEDIDHWKSVNCNLEDEVADLKSQLVTWRARYEDLDGPSDVGTHVSESNASQFMPKGGPSAAQMAMVRKDDDDDHYSTVSEPASSIANLWSKLTTPTSKRKTLDSDSVKEVIARTTFH